MGDEAERKRFLASLRRDGDFRADVRPELLTEEVLSLPQTLATLMERTITLIGEGFTAVRGEISDLRTDMETGFLAVNAKFDQIDADIREIKDQLAS